MSSVQLGLNTRRPTLAEQSDLFARASQTIPYSDHLDRVGYDRQVGTWTDPFNGKLHYAEWVGR